MDIDFQSNALYTYILLINELYFDHYLFNCVNICENKRGLQAINKYLFFINLMLMKLFREFSFTRKFSSN